MTYTLFLDDIRFPEDVLYDYGPYRKVIICRSMDDAVWCVKQYGIPNLISFDHDLADIHYTNGDGEKTGYTFAKWFCDYIMDNDFDLGSDFSFHVHSMNPVGSKNIRAYMKNFLKSISIAEKCKYTTVPELYIGSDIGDINRKTKILMD